MGHEKLAKKTASVKLLLALGGGGVRAAQTAQEFSKCSSTIFVTCCHFLMPCPNFRQFLGGSDDSIWICSCWLLDVDVSRFNLDLSALAGMIQRRHIHMQKSTQNI